MISQGILSLMEHSGFEPLTSTMRMQRATSFANAHGGLGGWLGVKVRLPRPANCVNAPW